MRSQIMSQLLRNRTVPPRPGRVMGPARAGLKAAPFSAPHEGAEDQGQADRDRREVGGRRPRCSPTWPAWAYRRHVCAEPLDARGCGSLHHMPSRQERPTVSLLRLRRADHRGRNRSRTRRRIVARVLGPRPERLSICGAGLCPPEPLIRLRIAASSNADVLEPDGDRLAVRNYLYPYARVIARALAARVAEGFWVRFAPDSPVEGDGFEPSVPRDRVMVFSRTLRPDSFPEIDSRSEPFSLHPQNLPYRCAVIDRQMSPQTGEAMTKRDRRPVAFNLTISL